MPRRSVSLLGLLAMLLAVLVPSTVVFAAASACEATLSPDAQVHEAWGTASVPSNRSSIRSSVAEGWEVEFCSTTDGAPGNSGKITAWGFVVIAEPEAPANDGGDDGALDPAPIGEDDLYSGPGGNCDPAGSTGKIDGVSVGTTYDLGDVFDDSTFDGITIEILDDANRSVEVVGGDVELCLKAGPGNTGSHTVADGGSFGVGETNLRVGAQGQSVPGISNIVVYRVTPTADDDADQLESLRLTYITECPSVVEDRGGLARWRVRNTNNVDVPFTWVLDGGRENGSGTAAAAPAGAASADTFFLAPRTGLQQDGSHDGGNMQIFVDGVRQDTKSGNVSKAANECQLVVSKSWDLPVGTELPSDASATFALGEVVKATEEYFPVDFVGAGSSFTFSELVDGVACDSTLSVDEDYLFAGWVTVDGSTFTVDVPTDVSRDDLAAFRGTEGAVIPVVNTLDCDDQVEPSPSLTIDKVLDGDAAGDVEDGTEFRICVTPAVHDDLVGEGLGRGLLDLPVDLQEVNQLPALDWCVTFTVDNGEVSTDDETTLPLLPGDYHVLEVEDGGADAVRYTVDGENAAATDEGVLVMLGSDDVEVTITNTFNGQSDDPEDETFRTPIFEPVVLGETLEPTAALTSACVVDTEDLLITYTLDNSRSTVAVLFTVVHGGMAEEIEVAATEVETGSITLAAGAGALGVSVQAGGDELASDTFDPAACGTEVAGVVEEQPEREPEVLNEVVAQPAPVAVQRAAAQAALPRTGAPALALALLGLLGVGLGGGLLASRRRE